MSDTILDFRSDTVTKPTAQMREAMAKAEVGDDVYQEDPTVNQLQDLAAELTGKESGLFVPSGTMGNLTSILSHCQRGDEIIVGRKAHIFLFEATGAAALGGVNIQTVPNEEDGTILIENLKNAIRPDDPHQPISRMIGLENTHNRCDGASLSPEYVLKVSRFARENNLILHIDGARIFNAAIDQSVPVSELTKPADSVTFCLSKGLSAPVGSVICGTKTFIQKARRVRKQLGGGMRQAGVIAAAGIVALTNMVDRLAEDHQNARILAEGLANIPEIKIDIENQHTNMVYFGLSDNAIGTLTEFRSLLKHQGLLVGGDNDRIRMVTHVWVDKQSVKKALNIIQGILTNL